MTTSETVFAVFFAIFWGSIMNVSGRWKMFQPFIWHGRIFRRFALSFVVMVVLPVWYFAVEYQYLNRVPLNSTWDVARAVLPALFIYVFYRVWMVVVGCLPTVFYWMPTEPVPNYRLRRIDPSPEDLGLPPYGYGPWGNVFATVFYIGVALGGAIGSNCD